MGAGLKLCPSTEGFIFVFIGKNKYTDLYLLLSVQINTLIYIYNINKMNSIMNSHLLEASHYRSGNTLFFLMGNLKHVQK